MKRNEIQNLVELANEYVGIIENLESTLADMQKDACDRWMALRLLVDKLDAIEQDKSFQGIWSFLAAHRYNYTGPNYKEELDAARNLLNGDQQAEGEHTP